MMKPIKKHNIHNQNELISWYHKNKRELPWRTSKNPYLIWISEVMLQQTTVTAVIPFYTQFILRFPDVKTLAQASIEEVYKYWAGLGYYSRARNLHKAASLIVADHKGVFPETAEELIKLPGFGPYTSRAVASLANNQLVGVLDGNVIRILTRKYGLKINWWETKHKDYLQMISDEIALNSSNDSSSANQAMMELGATICTPKKTMCLFCPWQKSCASFEKNLVDQIPLKKPKEKHEIWQWTFNIESKNNKIKLYENLTTPFLKMNWLPESTAKKILHKPKNFDFKHGVTKYDIYVSVNSSKSTGPKSIKIRSKWVNQNQISEINPTSLMKKILLQFNEKKDKLKL